MRRRGSIVFFVSPSTGTRLRTVSPFVLVDCWLSSFSIVVSRSAISFSEDDDLQRSSSTPNYRRLEADLRRVDIDAPQGRAP